MAVLRASPLVLPLPQLLSPASASSHSNRPACRRVTSAATLCAPPYHCFTSGVHGCSKKRALGRRRSGAVWRGAASCLPTKADEVGVAGSFEKEDKYLVREAGWGVRQMGRVGEEMRRVAQVQAEAFHVPVALFNDFFYDFFKAEVLSALIYKVRNSPPDRNCMKLYEPETETCVSCKNGNMRNHGAGIDHLVKESWLCDGSERGVS